MANLTGDVLSQLQGYNWSSNPTSPLSIGGLNYSPIYSGGEQSEGGYSPGTLSGYSSMIPGATTGGTYNNYDLQGNLTGTHPIMNGGSYSPGDFKDLGQAVATLGSMYLGGQGLSALGAGSAGGIGGTGFASGTGGATTGAGLGSAVTGTAGDTLSKAALDGTNAFGANSIGGAYDLASGGTSALGGGATGAIEGGFNAAKDSQLANTAITAAGGDALSGYGSNATDPTISNFGTAGTVANTLAKTLGGGGTNTNGGGGLNLGNLAGLLSGIYGMNQQSGAANDMLNYLKQRQSMNDNMYAPGSPEYNQMKQEMERNDAAAGRNSQYGPRSVDLAAKIAQLKMANNTQLTSNIAKYMSDSLNQRANAGINVTSSIPSLLGGSGSSGLGNLDLGSIIGSGTGNVLNSIGSGISNIGSSIGGALGLTPQSALQTNTQGSPALAGGIPPSNQIAPNNTPSANAPQFSPTPTMAAQTNGQNGNGSSTIDPTALQQIVSGLQNGQSSHSNLLPAGAQVYKTNNGTTVQDFSGVHYPQASFNKDGSYTTTGGQTISADHINTLKQSIANSGSLINQYIQKYGKAPDMLHDPLLNGSTSDAALAAMTPEQISAWLDKQG